MADLRRDCTVILIPEFEDEGAALHYVYTHFVEIFEVELESWCLDESSWPGERDLRVFKEWFEVEVHLVVTDLVDDDGPAGDTLH